MKGLANTTVFRIFNKKTGLFSKGGSPPGWNKIGKVWKQLSHLNLHFGQVDAKHYIDCDVVQYETIITSTFSAEEFIQIIHKRHAERDARQVARAAEERKQQRLCEYEKLKKEFGD